MIPSTRNTCDWDFLALQLPLHRPTNDLKSCVLICILCGSRSASVMHKRSAAIMKQYLHANRQLSFSTAISTRACFGAGCYWGTEKFFKIDYGKKINPSSQIRGQVGFMGPRYAQSFPTYEEVCSGLTGHVEVYDFFYNGDEITYETLVRHFFMFHDPTTVDRQGNDMGSQYASVIYCYDKEQKAIATRVRDELQEYISAGIVSGYSGKYIVTEIRDATTFYKADETHQSYLEKNPNGYCNHRYRFKKWPCLE